MPKYKSSREECSRLTKALGDIAHFWTGHTRLPYVVIAMPDKLFSACYRASEDGWSIFYPYGEHADKQTELRGKTFDEVVEFFLQQNKSGKEKLLVIKRKIADLVEEKNLILDEYLGEDEGQFHKVGTWDCEKSPVGLCVYNPVLDRALDDCIYCHHPHQRL